MEGQAQSQEVREGENVEHENESKGTASQRVGVSIRTRKPTHPPRPTRKSANPTPVTVGDRSPPPKTDLGRSDGGFASSKPNIPDPTEKIEERTPVLPRSVQIHRYSGEKFGSFWLDSMKILVFSLDPMKILVFLLRSSGEMKILLDFYLDLACCGAFASILLRSGLDFCFNSCLMWCFCSNLGLI